MNSSELLLSQRQEFLSEMGHPAGSRHGSQGEAAGDDASVETFTMALVWPRGLCPGQEIPVSSICGVPRAGREEPGPPGNP